MIKEFREFILRGNVVDLAIAVVIGAAFGAVVAAFVADLVTPLIAAIGGKPDFGALSFTINGSRFASGHFLNAVISFLIIAAVIFFVIVKPLNAFLARRKAKEEPAPEAPAEDVALLTEIRDLLRQGFTPSRPT
jgi:large conductance mechanosensitive channel